jgi:RimJ/RimL family protein N-acetyltransferase
MGRAGAGDHLSFFQAWHIIIFPQPPPEHTVIRGSDIILRHIQKNDLAELIPLLTDLELRGEHLPTALVSPLELEQKFDADGMAGDAFTRMLIVEKGSGRLIGSIWHFKSVPYFNAREIGYTMLSTEHRGRGYATQAVRLLARHLFDSYLINRLEIRMASANLASEKVAQKCGFTKEGVARGANFVRGRHVDMNVYALLRDELPAQ